MLSHLTQNPPPLPLRLSNPFQTRTDATAEAERVARREAELALRASLAAESEAIEQRQRAADVEKRAAERQKSARELAELRCRWLDDVERLVTAGDYRGALQEMDEDTDNVLQPDAPFSAAAAPGAAGKKALLEALQDAAASSSPESFAWAMDMMFFRMVALSEHALTELEFNTPEQHGAIQRAFAESTRYLQGFKERREETREYVTQLQRRVFQRYCNELSNLGMQETTLFHTGASASSSAAENCQRILQRGVQSYQQPVLSNSQVSTAKGFMEQITAGFLFIMELKGDLVLPLRSGAGERIADMQAYTCLNTVARSMLIAFDRGDFDMSVRLAGHLIRFVDENASFLNMFDMAIRPFFAGRVTSLDSSFVRHMRSLSVLVTKLADPYRDLALQGWSRLGGVLADVAEQGKAESFAWPALQDFITGALEGMTYAAKHCCGGMGQKFIYETLYDPVMITERQFNVRLLGSRTQDSCEKALGKAFTKYLKNGMNETNNGADSGMLNGALEEYQLNHHAELRIFRKAKFDKLRADLLSLYIAMGRVTEAYIGLSASSFADMTNCMYLKTRLEVLPMVKLKLYMCIKILFGLESIRTSPVVPVLLLLGVFENDQEMHKHHGLCYPEDGHPEFSGQVCLHSSKFESPAEADAFDCYSFDCQVIVLLPMLLRNWTIFKERKRLAVVHALGICSKTNLDGILQDTNLHSLAFEILHLIELRPMNEPLPKSKVAEALRASRHDLSSSATVNKPGDSVHAVAASQPGNPSISPAEEGKEGHRIHKLIQKLQNAIQGFSAQDLLQERTEGVACLLRHLQNGAQKRSRLPRSLIDSIESSGSGNAQNHLMLTAAKYIHPWSLVEIHEIRSWVMRLERLSERVTTLLHHTLGGNFPVAYAVGSNKWTLKSASDISNLNLSPATLKTIQDLKTVKHCLENMSPASGQ